MSGLEGIVAIVGQWRGDRFWDHDIAGEMDYCLYLVTFDNLCQHRRVARVALIEGNVRGKQPAISSREIIENHHRTADGATGQHCMAADIACTSRNDYCTACPFMSQDCHTIYFVPRVKIGRASCRERVCQYG